MIRTPFLASLLTAGAAVLGDACFPSVTHAGEVVTLVAPSTPLLTRLRDFRATLRGGGAPNFEWQLGSGDGVGLKMQVGTQALPVSELLGLGGSAPALGVSTGKFLIGSTAPSNFLDRKLGAREAFLSGPASVDGQGAQFLMPALGPSIVAAPKAGDQSEISWLAARPLESKAGNLNLLFARGRRDLTPTQAFGKRLVGGNWWGGNGELALTPTWKLRGEWMSGKTEEQDSNAAAWKLSLDGPLRHPWGEARFSALYRGADPGWSSYADPRPAVGGQQKEVSVSQDVKIGDISGTTRLGFMGSEVPVANVATDAQSTSAAPTRNESVEGTAQLRWQVSSSVALTTAHAHRSASQEKGGTGEDRATQNLLEQNTSEVGVEVKISPSLAVSVGAGQTRVGSDLLKVDAEAPTPISMVDEDRTAIALRRRTRGGAWSLQWNRKNTAETVQRSADRNSSGLQIEAERQVLPWLKVKGGLNLSGDDNLIQRIGNDGARRRVEAELSHARLGRLGLSYNDWQQRQSTLGPIDSPTAPLALGDNSYSIRYNLGDATGLGLALEYARVGRAPEGGAATPGSWRIGITYR